MLRLTRMLIIHNNKSNSSTCRWITMQARFENQCLVVLAVWKRFSLRSSTARSFGHVRQRLSRSISFVRVPISCLPPKFEYRAFIRGSLVSAHSVGLPSLSHDLFNTPCIDSGSWSSVVFITNQNDEALNHHSICGTFSKHNCMQYQTWTC